MPNGTTEGRIERLSPLDVSNLRIETRGVPMHVAALAFVEGAPLTDGHGQLRSGAVRERIEARLSLAPRLRQVLYRPSVGLGPPLWVDDPRFDIRHHVRTRAIPHPGDEATLLVLCAELNEPPLDRSRPLWELWLLPGLADGTVAILVRLHHAVADGLAALMLMGALLDPTRDAVSSDPCPWSPQSPPGMGELCSDSLRRYHASLTGAARTLGSPARATTRLRSLSAGARRLRHEGPAPRLSMNRPVGRHRRLLLLRAGLEDIRATAHLHRATINDVVLTAVAAGARGLLQARGELTPGLSITASVAASLRTPAADGRPWGNRVGIMLVPLPVSESDPLRGLQQIAAATASRKQLPAYQPMGRLAQSLLVRTMFHQRLVNLFTSNFPGPAMPVSLAGARLRELFQLGVVQGNVPLSVGVISYDGQLNFSLVGDADTVPDLDVFAAGMAEVLDRF
ncbi:MULTISPECIES: wax ester/triacylglycerol synthase family O-acyltransferase [unclassified Streptomyces]|uniref:wax ester/triacylglycerol synthase family O-acyltransferase n=1 Tax=unclassified Streptomyces TaxID=2593676 RepID=UPI0023668C84|nr:MULTISPECIES: wax ester/triacylglycerol synthase family O-acyltransferase [unclassified Streptomyces]MDF3146265.1 wax ester/triacylglycerol synthase family O-acyltransferase [Streptomyces sp. T21Q-yed]WDF43869.1 wax ester/triacylglycerol synthase family O-acyltransferase [Streptomyces sp. T12]